MTGACRPALCPTSTKRAWKGRPEGADLGNGLALCVESPCVRGHSLPRENADPIANCANLRRVIVIGRRSPGIHAYQGQTRPAHLASSPELEPSPPPWSCLE